MIKIDNETLDKFIKLMEDYDEFLFFDTKEELKKQLEMCLNTQGYWSGCSIKVYYDDKAKGFIVKNRF